METTTYIHPAQMTAEQRSAVSANAHASLARALAKAGRVEEAKRAAVRADRIAKGQNR
jgi:hypothetical protein